MNAPSTPKKKQPNIVLILNDDMGYSDLGCYGGEIETPNLDRLAANGLRFSSFYNTARCSPSRASMLTGLHPHQTGVGILTYDSGPEGYAGNLNQRCVTIPQVLRAHGYRTYMSGKWHVASSLIRPTDTWPLQRGFDEFYGTIIGAGSFYDPNTLTRGNENVEHEAHAEGFFYTDAISDQAVEYIERHARERPEQPFFEYVAYTAPHWPLHAHEEDIATLRGPLRRRLGQAARGAAGKARRLRPAEGALEADRARPEPAAVERGRGRRAVPRLDAALHGGLRGAGGPHGPGHRPDPRRAREERPARRHAGRLPRRQRRLRRRHSARRDDRRAGREAHDRAPHDAQRRAGALRQRHPAHARAGEHLPELRHRLGQPLERAVPPLQALDPRRRHLDAADRALAERHRREGRAAPRAGLPAGHHGDDPRRRRRRPTRPSSRAAGSSRSEGQTLLPVFARDGIERKPMFWEHEGNAAVRIGKLEAGEALAARLGALRHGRRPHRAARPRGEGAGARRRHGARSTRPGRRAAA